MCYIIGYNVLSNFKRVSSASTAVLDCYFISTLKYPQINENVSIYSQPLQIETCKCKENRCQRHLCGIKSPCQLGEAEGVT